MSSAPKKTKKKKEVKKEAVKELAPQVVTCQLADNSYSGVIREGPLGMQFLECADAKYEWGSGVKYEGPFVASRIDGKGKFLWPDGSSYEGELLNGKRHGHGVYHAAEGGSRYEGQWVQGRREGNGKLIYGGEETSYYDGGWLDGKKHGFGKQVWPSGNIYEGEWAFGKMAGQGTMTWRTAAGSERYSGRWEANFPDGDGTHTWHTVDLTREPPPGASVTDGYSDSQFRRPMALNMQQQMNNCYTGQWSKGRRHGTGTFMYANGARYHGEWVDHMKHGKGRHTFEDGTVYEGDFEEDRMCDYRKPHPAEGSELVARCTDLRDIVGLALPQDRSGIMATGGAGYTDKGKIFREVYNILLRHLGELRELYGRYRAAIPRTGSDPFTLQSYQLWLLARDAGLVTPACSLAHFNRCFFAGPRHHRDWAPDDMASLKPLTREDIFPARAQSSDSKKGCHVSIMEAGLEEDVRTELDAAEGTSASASEASSAPSSPAHGEPGRSGDAAGAALASVPEASAQAEGSRPQSVQDPPGSSQAKRRLSSRPTSQGSMGRRASRLVLGEAFKRPATSESLADTHSDCRPLLFRQFLEGIARCAPMRFPNERGLEAQIHRLFKHCLLPAAADLQPPPAEPLLGFLAAKETQGVLKEFRDELWDIFKAPQSPEQRPFPAFRTNRTFTVNARMDVTLRIKDLIRMLESCGFLKPAAAGGDAPEGPLEGVEVFPAASEEDDGAASADEQGSGGSQAGQDITSGFLQNASKSLNGIGGLGGGGFGGFGLTGAPGKAEELPPEGAKGSKKKGKGSKEAPRSQEEIDRDEVQACDFSLTLMESLRHLAEVLSPSTLPNIHWALRPSLPSDFAPPCDDAGSSAAGDATSSAGGAEETTPQLLWPPLEEQVSILEWVENGVTFAEFLRLIVQLMETGVKSNAALVDRLSTSRRLEVFLRHVFLPALREKYAPPREEEEDGGSGRRHSRESLSEAPEEDPLAPPVEEAPLASELAEAPETATEQPEGEGAREASEPASAEPEVELPQRWPGFEGPGLPPRGAAAAADAAALKGGRRGLSRHWPAGYGEEAAEW